MNISNTCYTGPVVQKDLVLITCSKTKQLTTVNALQKCHTQDNQVICPTYILNTVTKLEWLGFEWHRRMKIQFPRWHVPAKNCDGLHNLFHLGSRYYLAATSVALHTNEGSLTTSPLQILQFPCKVTFNSMATGLSTCPDTMEIHIPIYSRDTVTYIPWHPSADSTRLQSWIFITNP